MLDTNIGPHAHPSLAVMDHLNDLNVKASATELCILSMAYDSSRTAEYH